MATATKQNRLLELTALGQSVWLDFIRRDLIRSGELGRKIEYEGVRGVTSNPAIFEKAIAGSDEYDEEIRRLAKKGLSVEQVYERLAVKDIQDAADELRNVYARSDGADGFVSLEVSPRLAHDAPGTIDEARRLWREVDRPNVMIKIPATREGISAIRRCIAEGINVNVTLLFGLERYREAATAYILGLRDRVAQKLDVRTLASVASFFVSRIDTLVDALLEKLAAEKPAIRGEALELRGRAAVASAKLAYQAYREIFHGEEFAALRSGGARVQRLLWASTSTKNPAYSDVKYVEPLIGPDTVNTMPPETLSAFGDHGRSELTLAQGAENAANSLDRLEALGIRMDDVADRLEDEGVEKFVAPFESLMDAIRRKAQ